MPKKQKNKKKTDKPLYDENGRWVEERGRIKGAIRRTFRLSPQMKEVLNEARVELPPLPTKDGKSGKKVRVRFKCAHCNELFPLNKTIKAEGKKKKRKITCVQVDHIDTVVPLWMSESDMPFERWVYTIARGVFAQKDNLQILCSIPTSANEEKESCHRKKTNLENYLRRRWKKMAEEENMDGYPGYDWDLSKPAHKEWVEKHHAMWTEEYKEELKTKEEKKNARRERKNRKRKSDPSTD